ncbi:MAG: aminotransferase class I/II-fold pyridoxal phosphate-dependent enzyme [Planctomycetes bacterium]|nr:aminotransferase class I/II-fold pyridoxal phosphate-dependent enzyme [Planctomycetota bacterium]
MEQPRHGFETSAIHGDGGAREGPVSPSIVTASTFRFSSVEDLALANAGKIRKDRFYLRYGSPNLTSVEERVSALEGSEASLLFASGMAAISAVAFALLRPGSRMIVQREIYGGTLSFVRDVLIPWGVAVEFVSIHERGAFESACSRKADLIFTETPTNPLCRIADLRDISKQAARAGALHACDATFASPYNQKTLALGADLVVQSATKYLGGHSDLLGGTVAGSAALVARIETIRRRMGAVPDAQLAWRLERSLKTLAVRVERQNRSAFEIAQFLSAHPKIEKVYYPGLPSHPDHVLARSQMSGFGGMLAFDVRGGEPTARKFVNSLELIAIAPSLGGVETLISPPMHTSHASIPPEERRRAGISDGSLRLSVGLESLEDIVSDLTKAFLSI